VDQGKKDSVKHVHQIYIRASAQAIWDAITDPTWNGRYGYQAVQEYDLKPGGKYRAIANEGMKQYGLPETIIDGEILEVKPPLKLVQTYRWHFSEEHVKEGYTRLTYEITPSHPGFCLLTVTHDVTGAPLMSAATQSTFDEKNGGGGWNWILSDIKSLLETGKLLSG
jgi:uncharacterized protein YndB with AHSA1/START domain